MFFQDKLDDDDDDIISEVFKVTHFTYSTKQMTNQL